MESDNKDNGYEIGYGRPPLHTRFKKGESGNYRGRPRARKNLATIVAEELRETIVISKNGRRRRITKVEAIAMRMVNNCLKEDNNRATQTLLSYLDKHPYKEVPRENPTVEELESKTNLLREAVQILSDMGVPGTDLSQNRERTDAEDLSIVEHSDPKEGECLVKTPSPNVLMVDPAEKKSIAEPGGA